MILLYEDIFDCPEEIEAAKKVGFEIQKFDINNCWIGNLPSKPFIFRGSLEGLAWLDRMDHPYYQKISDIEQYAFSSYYHNFNDRLLNKDFVLLPAGKILESKDMLFNIFGGDRIFIKPNNGDKLFTGTYLSKKWYDKDWETVLKYSNKTVMLSDMLLVSSYKEVGEETRYVVNDFIVSDLDYPEWLDELVAQSGILDYYYTIDVAGDKIVEINCMSCSGLNDSFETVYRNIWNFHVDS